MDLTTPPPVQQVKREPKDERSDSAGPAGVEGQRNQQHGPPLDVEYLADQPRTNRVQQQGLAVGHVSESPPANDVPRQQEDLPTTVRPPKKKKQSDSRFTPVVDDVQYLTIIKDPNGDHQGLVEVTCKFCEANCAVRSGRKLLYKGETSWRGHVSNCHRSDLPAGTKITTSYLIESCLTFRQLTPQEAEAVLTRNHAAFVVAMRPGPGAQPSTAVAKRKRKHTPGGMRAYQEDEAERGILEAVEDPVGHGIASMDANDEEEDSDTEYAPEDRPFGMSTRRGGRRTRVTPDFMIRKVE